MSQQDRVAVLIAAKDAAGTIAYAIGSALLQAEVAEIIVVDDGSSDATAAVARGCDDGTGRLRVIRLERNAGPSAARNRAIELSQSAILCVLDADDRFAPGRLRAILDEAGEDWDLAADGILMLKEGAAEETARRHDFRELVGQPVLTAAAFIEGNISRPGQLRRELGFMKPLMRRSFLDRHAMRYDEGLRLGEDYALYAEALLRGARFRLTSECHYLAIWRSASLSGGHSAGDLVALAAVDDRLCGIDPSLRGPLRRHAASIRQKAAFRTALDLKSRRAFRPLAVHLLTNASTLPYMVKESVRAYLG